MHEKYQKIVFPYGSEYCASFGTKQELWIWRITANLPPDSENCKCHVSFESCVPLVTRIHNLLDTSFLYRCKISRLLPLYKSCCIIRNFLQIFINREQSITTTLHYPRYVIYTQFSIMVVKENNIYLLQLCKFIYYFQFQTHHKFFLICLENKNLGNSYGHKRCNRDTTCKKN